MRRGPARAPGFKSKHYAPRRHDTGLPQANRLRPITMSTPAMILALRPLGAAINGSGNQMPSRSLSPSTRASPASFSSCR